MNFRATCRLAARRPAARRTEALKFRAERPSASRPLAPLSPAACSAAQHLRLIALQPDGLRLCAWGLSILWSVGLRHSWQSSARRPATASPRPNEHGLAWSAPRLTSSPRPSPDTDGPRLSTGWLSALRPGNLRLSTLRLCAPWPGDLQLRTLRLSVVRPVAPYFSERQLPAQHPAAERPASAACVSAHCG